MTWNDRFNGLVRGAVIGSALAWAVVAGGRCRGDSVIMKNGIVYRGQGRPTVTTRSSLFPTG